MSKEQAREFLDKLYSDDDFTEEEFQDATTDYVQDLGAMKALASGLRVNELAKKVQKGKL